MEAGVILRLSAAVVLAFVITLWLFWLFPDKPIAKEPVAWCDVPESLMPDFNGMSFFPCRELPIDRRA